MTEQWQAISAAFLRHHRWSARAVVYNDLSGHTHLLDAMTTVVFEVLLERACTSRELSQETALLFELPCDDRLHAWVETLLARLERLGVIEPVAGLRERGS